MCCWCVQAHIAGRWTAQLGGEGMRCNHASEPWNVLAPQGNSSEPADSLNKKYQRGCPMTGCHQAFIQRAKLKNFSVTGLCQSFRQYQGGFSVTGCCQATPACKNNKPSCDKMPPGISLTSKTKGVSHDRMLSGLSPTSKTKGPFL